MVINFCGLIKRQSNGMVKNRVLEADGFEWRVFVLSLPNCVTTVRVSCVNLSILFNSSELAPLHGLLSP